MWTGLIDTIDYVHGIGNWEKKPGQSLLRWYTHALLLVQLSLSFLCKSNSFWWAVTPPMKVTAVLMLPISTVIWSIFPKQQFRSIINSSLSEQRDPKYSILIYVSIGLRESTHLFMAPKYVISHHEMIDYKYSRSDNIFVVLVVSYRELYGFFNNVAQHNAHLLVKNHACCIRHF